jgi:hypothetical protein
LKKLSVDELPEKIFSMICPETILSKICGSLGNPLGNPLFDLTIFRRMYSNDLSGDAFLDDLSVAGDEQLLKSMRRVF